MIAITVKENNLNSKIELCFGKSEYFFIYDTRTKSASFINNPGKKLQKNSGKKAVMLLKKLGVKTVFSLNFGVPVKKLFDKYKVQMVILSPQIKYLKDIEWIKKK
jgi:predicted Fe-Mo cluster-binding NifX family protein